ncbi:MFS transporter [Streptomyces sp. NPDC102437]|uniref:MFS transporter n=1 Tax=Streptomyces sp. NPDC102437 TaxID=3366175 RepID=UPI0038025D72
MLDSLHFYGPGWCPATAAARRWGGGARHAHSQFSSHDPPSARHRFRALHRHDPAGRVRHEHHLQAVRGIAASSAGLCLIPMAIGMTAVGLLSERPAAAGWSQKAFVLSGTACASAALALLATLSTDTSLWTVRAALLLMGIGFGQLMGQLVQLVQDTAPAEQLGVATTGVRFFQNLGGALGAALFGTVLSRVYAARGPGGTTSTMGRLTGHAHQQALEAFVASTNVVFWAATGVMLLATVLATRLPSRREPEPKPEAADTNTAEFTTPQQPTEPLTPLHR